MALPHGTHSLTVLTPSWYSLSHGTLTVLPQGTPYLTVLPLSRYSLPHGTPSLTVLPHGTPYLTVLPVVLSARNFFHRYIGFNRATLAALLKQQQACKGPLATITQTLKASRGQVEVAALPRLTQLAS